MKYLFSFLFSCTVLFATAPMVTAFENFKSGLESVGLKLETQAFADAAKLCRDALESNRLRQADPALKGFRLSDEQALQLELMAAVLETKGNFKKMKVPRSELPPETIEKVTYATAKALNTGFAFDYAKFLATKQEREVPRYNVSFLTEAPRSVAAWQNSPLRLDASKRETRFERYDRKAAAGLIYDVNLVRNLQELPADDKPCPTSFFVAADTRAIYIYSETRDEKADEVLAGLADGGMYEMYIQPGFDESYYQWLLTLSDPPTRWCPTWGSPNKHYRLIDGYMTYEVAQIPGGIGILTTIPWEFFYDKLPDKTSEWPLGIIPWVRDGGFTWGSGQVHELHKFGRLIFKDIPEFLPSIKRWIVLRSWARYKKQIDPIKIFWNDEVHGDLEFARTILLPTCEKLDALGREVAIDMPPATTEKLFRDAVPQWHEIDYMIAELRTEYLKKTLAFE